MSKCPKCGYKLKLSDIGQHCPSCGVNLCYYNFEENFYREAKWAELSQANLTMKIMHLKAAFIGNKLAILRLALMFLPIAALFIPSGSFSISLPFKDAVYGVSGLGLFNLFSGGDFGYIMGMTGSPILGAGFCAIKNALIVYAVPVVLAVCVLLSTILCFVSFKKTSRVIAIISALGALSSLAAGVLIPVFGSACGENVSFQAGFGAYAVALMFLADSVLNFIIQKKGLPVEYPEGIEERVAIYKQVRKGKVKLDDLSQPVVETEATRKIDEEIAEHEAKLEALAKEREGKQ